MSRAGRSQVDESLMNEERMRVVDANRTLLER